MNAEISNTGLNQQSSDDGNAAVTYCSQVLRSRLDGNSGVLGAVMATLDGRAFAHAFRPGVDMQAPRIAAVSSSLLALSESFSKEALGSAAKYNSTVTEQGNIITVRVGGHVKQYILCVWTEDSENFAMALRFSLDSAKELASVVDTIAN